MTDIKKSLLLLFDRPNEPVFTMRDNDVQFQVPEEFYTKRYRPLAPAYGPRSGGGKKIFVKEIPLPKIDAIRELKRNEHFSTFIPKHQKLAGELIDIFMDMETTEDFMACAVYAHDRVNAELFQYAFSTALIHRDDTKDMSIPSLMSSFPGKFVDSSVLGQLREESFIVTPDSRQPIRIPRDYTASSVDPEHRLWFFREDPGLNLHHWHWHLVYPHDARNPKFLNKDRRGELFFYMHQQIIARYNAERLGNCLSRVKPFNDFRQPIVEGYFPKMDSSVATRSWPGRPDNAFLSDIDRDVDQIHLELADLELWRDRILQAIDQLAVTDPNGEIIPLEADESTDSGIDILGNIIESSSLSSNRDFYGQLHNFGHLIIAYVNDPKNKHKESFGVMNDTSTACRDPVFYRWHAFINGLFLNYKKQLAPYTLDQLMWSKVKVISIEVQPEVGPVNTFQTFFNTSTVDFSRGLDFMPRGAVMVEFDHLNHESFTYKVKVQNRTGQRQLGMFRVFMGPKKDEHFSDMTFDEQRHLMIEMDKFIVQLNPGSNVIQHTSESSSVTIPFEQTFRNLDAGRPKFNSPDADQFNVCGCGWPHHLLVPRGQKGVGQDFQFFVMVSNFELDKLEQSPSSASCKVAATFCGIRDEKYPDMRPMGYPFDRVPREGVDKLDSFLTPNMMTQDVKIIFTDDVRERLIEL